MKARASVTENEDARWVLEWEIASQDVLVSGKSKVQEYISVILVMV